MKGHNAYLRSALDEMVQSGNVIPSYPSKDAKGLDTSITEQRQSLLGSSRIETTDMEASLRDSIQFMEMDLDEFPTNHKLVRISRNLTDQKSFMSSTQMLLTGHKY